MPHGPQRSWTHFVFIVVFVLVCVVGKNPNIPNLSLMAVDAITRGGIGVGSSPKSKSVAPP